MRVLFALFLTVSFLYGSSIKRCELYKTSERVSHEAVFGLDFPWYYGMGQIQQESLCRNVLSNDGVGSQGIAQITMSVWGSFLAKKGIHGLKTTQNQTRSQAEIMKTQFDQSVNKKLWIAYQIYNGGGLVNKEIKTASKVYGTPITLITHDQAKIFCKRKIIKFNNGQTISACEINYDYSTKVYNYGNKYNLFETNNSSKFKYY